MASSIKIHNVISEASAEPLKAALQGQSYMGLEVRLSPVGGSFDVKVGTTHPDVSEAELTEMVLGILAHQICRAGRASGG